jgi:type II secretory pathway pseudopilin PulG
MKGQLSAEMLVVLVLVLGLAVLLASTMFKSANKAAEKVEEKTDSALGASDAASRLPTGSYCASNADCQSGSCDTYLGRCN